MNDFSAIDTFLEVFVRYIESGFGLVAGDVASLAGILIVIDVTLAALFWAWGQNIDVLQSLIKKTLYVGAFAFILNNFATLADVIFQSFSALGLKASAASFGPGDLMRPGLIAAEGMAASKPIFDQIGTIAPGPVEFFANVAEVTLLFAAGLIVIAAFFILALQLFVLIVEFKLTTLAGFVLVPFALWRQTTFLAERVLGNVMASGVKVLVIAVVLGIGSNLFADLRTALPAGDITIEQAFAVVLGSLTLVGLAVFCPRIAAGLVSGAPQLSAGAAVGTAVGVGAAGAATIVASQAAGAAALRTAGAAGSAAATTAGVLAGAEQRGAAQTGVSGPRGSTANTALGLGAAAAGALKDAGARLSAQYQARAAAGHAAVLGAGSGASAAAASGAAGPAFTNAGATNTGGAGETPAWMRRFRATQSLREGALVTAHWVQSGDGGAGSEGPDLKQRD